MDSIALRSNFANVLADLELHCPHMSKCAFIHDVVHLFYNFQKACDKGRIPITLLKLLTGTYIFILSMTSQCIRYAEFFSCFFLFCKTNRLRIRI